MKKLEYIAILLFALSLVAILSLYMPRAHAQQASAASDPCFSNSPKSSAAINISSATTTSLVSVSGTTTVYVCGFVVTISQVVTTANTITFVQGTGAACTGSSALTGSFGAGGVTAAAPITVSYHGVGTIFKSAASNGICATTAIGASGSFQGVLDYVQQ